MSLPCVDKEISFAIIPIHDRERSNRTSWKIEQIHSDSFSNRMNLLRHSNRFLRIDSALAIILLSTCQARQHHVISLSVSTCSITSFDKVSIVVMSHESLRFRISFFEMARHMNGSKKSASASSAWSQPRTSRDSMQFFEKFRRVRAALATENQRFNRHFNGQFDFQESAMSPNQARSSGKRFSTNQFFAQSTITYGSPRDIT